MTHVPREVFEKRLSLKEQKAVRVRILAYTMDLVRGSNVVTNMAEIEELVQIGIEWMVGLPSCEYLLGPNGATTLVRLSCEKIYYAYLDKIEKHQDFVDIDDILASAVNEPDENCDQGARQREDEQFISTSREPSTKDDELSQLEVWLHSQIDQLQPNFHVRISRTNPSKTRTDLRLIVTLILNSKQQLFTFENNHFDMKAGPIAALTDLAPNYVSKLGGILRKVISAGTMPTDSEDPQ